MHKLTEIMDNHHAVSNGQQLWSKLLYAGVVEYIDKDEERTLRVAVRPQDAINEMAKLNASEKEKAGVRTGRSTALRIWRSGL